MDRRQFLKSIGLITGGFAVGGVKAIKGVVKAAAAEPKPTFDFPVVKKVFAKTFSNGIVEVKPMAEPLGKLYFIDTPLTAHNRLTELLSENITTDIKKHSRIFGYVSRN